MTRNTGIYWTNEETARRAKWCAEAEGISVSAFVSNLVNDHYKECYPEPPIYGICPTCGERAEFSFLARWNNGLPNEIEPFNLYCCSHCQTSLSERNIRRFNSSISQEPNSVTKSEEEPCTV